MITEIVKNMSSGLANSILDLFFPPQCWQCDRMLSSERKVVCEDCFDDLKRFAGRTEEFDSNAFLFDQIYILFEFDDRLRSLVHMIKYQGCASLARYFAQEAANHLLCNNSKIYTRIIPVPLHPQRLRERGYNQSGEIARHLSTIVSIFDIGNPLVRIRHTSTQTKLDKKDRIKNISGAFICNQDVTGEHILIIDDVITTGSTLNECCRVLLKAGASSVDVLALANPRLGN